MLIDGTKRREDENMLSTQRGNGMIAGSTNAPQSGSRGPTSSGAFTNLNQYLSKNAGANNQTVQNLQNEANRTAQTAQQQTQAARQAGEQVQNRATQIRNDQQFVNEALQNPMQADRNRFNRLRQDFNANLTPDIQTYDSATAQANQARQQAQQRLQGFTTQGGLTEYLRSQRTTPRYSQGSQNLDRALIQGVPEGRSALESIGQKANELSSPADFGVTREDLIARQESLKGGPQSAADIRNAANQRMAQERQALLDYQVAQSGVGDKTGEFTAGTGVGGVLSGVGGPVRPSGDSDLSTYLAANDRDARVNQFNADQVNRWRAIAEMSGADPNELLNQNLEAFRNRQNLTNQRISQYEQIQRNEQAQAEAAAQAEAERQRQQQQLLGLLALYFGAQNSGGGGGLYN